MLCMRCRGEISEFTYSIFNTDTICMRCKEKERNHPLYKKAREIERQHVLAGDLNFEGIGKPEDL